MNPCNKYQKRKDIINPLINIDSFCLLLILKSYAMTFMSELLYVGCGLTVL